MTWQLEQLQASAAEHHARPMPDQPARAVWVHEVVRPALVLGSTQDESVVDSVVAQTLGIELVRRRSGGGAVLLVPGDVAWADVIVPAGDPLWDDDVGRSALWLGRVWQATLTDLGVAGTKVHEGSLDCGLLGRLVCFGAVAPGEVTLGERKVVGISQRRTRRAARLQCAVYRRWDPELLIRLLRLDDNPDAEETLSRAAVGVGAHPDEIISTFLRHLQA